MCWCSGCDGGCVGMVVHIVDGVIGGVTNLLVWERAG